MMRGSADGERRLAALAAFVVGYALLQEVAFALLQPPTYIPLLWPPAGLATAALLLNRRSRWPLYLLATGLVSLLGNQLHGQPAAASALYAGYNMLVPLAGAASYRLLGSRSPRLENMADVRNLLLGPGLVAPMVTSAAGIAVFVWAGVLSADGWLVEWEHHWVGQALGVLAIVPVALSWPRGRLTRDVRSDLLPAAAWLAVIVVGAWWSLGTSGSAAGTGLILELAPFLLLYLVAARYGRFAGAVGAALATGVVVAHVVGPFGFTAPIGLTDHQSMRLFRAVLLAIFLPTIALAVMVRERTQAQSELAEAQRQEVERLSRIDAMRRDFVNRAAHELNTPLTPLRFQVRALAEGMLGDINPRQAAAVDVLERNVLRLQHLADDLMTAGKLQSDQLALSRGAVDLADVAQDAAEAYRAQAEAQGITLAAETPDAPVLARGDRGRLYQVVSNLVSNAVRFAPAGGSVTVRVWEDAGLHLEVSDTGPGLTEEEAVACFEPFTQPVEAPVGTKPGTGLGLHVARGLAEAHGGTLTCIDPSKGHGARFRLTLPCGPSGEPPAAVELSRGLGRTA